MILSLTAQNCKFSLIALSDKYNRTPWYKENKTNYRTLSTSLGCHVNLILIHFSLFENGKLLTTVRWIWKSGQDNYLAVTIRIQATQPKFSSEVFLGILQKVIKLY